jgi:corrinoid protein of di/trimethylamine methyltransferase
MTMTHKQRIRAAFRGEMPDLLPYVPRIDLWYNANSYAGTLPEKHRGRTRDEISRAEGWALHKQLPDYLDVSGPEDMLHRGIGIMTPRQAIFRYRFTSNVDVRVKQDGDTTRVEYHTPIGVADTTMRFTEDLKKAGSTIPFIAEHIIRGRDDYRIVTYVFQNLELSPDYERFRQWEQEAGEDGFCSAFTTHCGSPIHHIQKDLIDATAFFLHYHDYQKEMAELAEAIEHHYHQWLKIAADSPAEAIGWGSNYDETITYAPYFEKEILPWLQKVCDALHGSGKVVNTHCDGENQGLMDLIKQTRADMAEAVCPHPMTKLTIEEYYRWWADEMTIFGGIPSNILLADSASDDEFEAYLDFLFKSIGPGRRFVVGIADTTPPDAIFERLVRIAERVEREGRLPMQAGAARPISASRLKKAAERVGAQAAADELLAEIREDVRKGRDKEIQAHVRQKLDEGISAKDLLNRGMLSVMEEIGERFKDGSVFIPEVLLSARAMNAALVVLQPHLAGQASDAKARVLIGTVHGDLHDIGKNLVVTMFKGIGLEVKDLGINVPTEEFVRQVAEFKPDVVGLSALLTTTMPEMKRVIEALSRAGLRNSVKVIVGGAPVNQKFARSIGADGYAQDAGDAVSLVKQSNRWAAGP